MSVKKTCLWCGDEFNAIGGYVDYHGYPWCFACWKRYGAVLPTYVIHEPELP